MTGLAGYMFMTEHIPVWEVVLAWAAGPTGRHAKRLSLLTRIVTRRRTVDPDEWYHGRHRKIR